MKRLNNFLVELEDNDTPQKVIEWLSENIVKPSNINVDNVYERLQPGDVIIFNSGSCHVYRLNYTIIPLELLALELLEKSKSFSPFVETYKTFTLDINKRKKEQNEEEV